MPLTNHAYVHRPVGDFSVSFSLRLIDAPTWISVFGYILYGRAMHRIILPVLDAVEQKNEVCW